MLRPRVLILPYWKGRHPDHYTASKLGYEAAFLAGLKKLATPEEVNVEVVAGEQSKVKNQKSKAEPHRPFKILCASLYYDVRPTFVVDITDQFEARFQSLMAYRSQYEDHSEGAGLFPAHAEIRARTEAMARFYGLLAGVTYAEPFVQKEVGLVEDVTAIPVRSI
jgi:LmbE family N-acetylglucosaminyl deacetylase